MKTLLLCMVLASSAFAESKRIAIIVGNNAGSGELPPLRYAESDAGKMARVLVELGDVALDDVLLLQGRKVSDVERAISDARERVAFFKKNPDTRTVLMFFFSGHSDGEAIELNGEKLPYGRLKALLTGTGADVRLSIVDACKSGGGLRTKGAKAADSFTIKLTDTLVATGEAFITSSAADEAALESSEVSGSYFTHNFISGLRGAADASGDKLVTLAEAYKYAYDRTVSATSLTSVGAQHPNYDFRISGQGELVLSTLLRPSAVLILPEGAERSVITDLARDQVVVEVPAGPAREIALAAGQYGLRLIKGGKTYGGRVALVDGVRKSIKWEELQSMTSSVIVASKGGGGAPSLDATIEPLRREDFFLTAAIGAVRSVSEEAQINGQLRVGFEPFRSHGLLVAVSLDSSLGRATSENSKGELEPSASGVQLRVGYRWVLEYGNFWGGLGVEAGAGFLWQVVGDEVRGTMSGVLAPRASARLRLGGPVWLAADFDVAVMLLKFNDSIDARVLPGGTFGIAINL